MVIYHVIFHLAANTKRGRFPKEEMATQFFPTTDLSPQFLNVSWVDIVEAEESEDFEAIERLR